jgi:acetate kinase
MRLRHLGVSIDEPDDGTEGDRAIQADGSVAVLVIASREDLEIARSVDLALHAA